MCVDLIVLFVSSVRQRLDGRSGADSRDRDLHPPPSPGKCNRASSQATNDTAVIRSFLPCGHLDFESAVTAQNDDVL